MHPHDVWVGDLRQNVDFVLNQLSVDIAHTGLADDLDSKPLVRYFLVRALDHHTKIASAELPHRLVVVVKLTVRHLLKLYEAQTKFIP